MQVTLTNAELLEAPEVVRNWITSRLSPSPTEETKPIPKMEEVLELAAKLLEKDKAVLKSILQKFGIKGVKACPEDKLADLLAEIAVHA
ncbi:MAG: hypothetical protein AAF802_19240 [Planctomycetota bacterium]